MPLLEFEKVSKIYRRRRSGFPAHRGNGKKAIGALPEIHGSQVIAALPEVHGSQVIAALPEVHGSQVIAALSEVSLSISPGQSLGVIGESGAGKSTLAALATGQTNPTAGRVLVDGRELGTDKKNRRWRAGKVQLIWQDVHGSVDPRMNVEKIIAEPFRVHGLGGGDEVRKNIERLLAEVGLPNSMMDRRPHELSGGELPRVVIARALALDPELLICDEPAAALDAHFKVQVAKLLVRLQVAKGMALMVIAHDLPLISMVTRELIVMYRGKILEYGPTGFIINNPLHPYSRLLISSDPSNPAFASIKAKPDNVQPNAGQDIQGCIFRHGCVDKVPVCDEAQPDLAEAEDGRLVACVLAKSRNTKQEASRYKP